MGMDLRVQDNSGGNIELDQAKFIVMGPLSRDPGFISFHEKYI